MMSSSSTQISKMLNAPSNSLLFDDNLTSQENPNYVSEEIQKPDIDLSPSSTAKTIFNFITAIMNNTFLNSADIRIADNTVNDESLDEYYNVPDDEISINNKNNNENNMNSIKSLIYNNNPSTEKTELIENIINEVNNDKVNNENFNINEKIESVITSTINYGYSTVLNLMSSLDATTSSSIDLINDFNQSDNNSNNFSFNSNNNNNSLKGATTSLNEFVNLNRSYYHHLPPSLLSGHQYSNGIGTYGGSQLKYINSIDNDNNDISIIGDNSNSGMIVGSLINSTIVNNLSDFIQNNNNYNNSTDEQYLFKLNNNDIDDNDELYAPGAKRDFVFDRTDVKIIFITLYSLVFCCCFFGNLLVILVVTLSRRLRSITNFFLANLAVADFCVGVFCVMQNLTIYLIDSWVFGKFLCKMYQFVHSLSYTASIFILIVICMERYFAIIHPITCKQILTPSRLRLVILGVWITSAVYSTPKFIFSKTITNVHTINGIEEHICILDRQMFNSELLDLINFGFLYVTPLLVMTILYSRIAIALWKSSRGLERHIALQNTSTCSPSYSGAHLYRKPSSFHFEKQHRGALGVTESQVSMEADKVVVTTWKKSNHFHQRHGTQVAQMSNSTNNVLRARRGVIRMLIIVVLTFALCNLPYHARKMWMYWSDTYKGYSNFNALFTPLTFLATYFNSGVNPLLYAFLSRNFRKGMRELLLCSFKKSKNKSSSMHQRVPLQEVASVVMQAVNLPLEKLKSNGISISDSTNDIKALHHDNSIKEQQTEIVSTDEI